MISREWFEVEVEAGPGLGECHILPCAIDYNGPVDAEKLAATKTPEGLRARFRGRQLHGNRVNLATHGFRGVTLDPSTPREATSIDESLDANADAETSLLDDIPLMSATQLENHGPGFSSVVVWEHARAPDADDVCGGRLDELLAFSRALHDEDINKTE